jgi:8-oxo-dGTP pyrophosphatase MutT (NUDIX family)
VVRECREELGCAVVPAGRVGTDLLIDAGVLRVHAAAVDGGPEPAALEHSALRWVGSAELDAVDWVDADRAVLPDLRARLGATARRPPRSTHEATAPASVDLDPPGRRVFPIAQGSEPRGRGRRR